jgi:hypothetical protein
VILCLPRDRYSFALTLQDGPYLLLESAWGVDVELHPFLVLVLDGGKWSVLYPESFMSVQQDSLCSLTRRLCGLDSQSGYFGEEKYIFPLPEI